MFKVREDQIEAQSRGPRGAQTRDHHRPGVDSIDQTFAAGIVRLGLPNAQLHAQSLNRLPQKGSAGASDALLRMQGAYGNRYVQRVLNIARKSDGEGEVASDVEASIEQSRSSGQALDGPARGQMESAFGVDFGGVRIHTGAESHALNRAVNAVAFTTGADIFFRDGAYAPGSTDGKQLLAHELTHVVQQGAAAPPSGKAQRFQIDRMCRDSADEEHKHMQTKLVVGPSDDAHEREAEAVASAVTAGLANAPDPQGNGSS